MKLLLENWQEFINEEIKTLSFEEVISLLKNNPDQRRSLDFDKGEGRKSWGGVYRENPKLVPFDYGEYPDLINAGKQTITTLPGAALFDSAMSFSMIRGQHVQLTVLGAMEVAQNGDIANWKIPGKMVKGMGGAMDLVASAENIIVAMMHTNRAGESKILKQCTLPITGVSCVKKVITNLAVLEVKNTAFKLLEKAPGVSIEDIKSATEANLIIEGEIPEMKV